MCNQGVPRMVATTKPSGDVVALNFQSSPTPRVPGCKYQSDNRHHIVTMKNFAYPSLILDRSSMALYCVRLFARHLLHPPNTRWVGEARYRKWLSVRLLSDKVDNSKVDASCALRTMGATSGVIATIRDSVACYMH